MDNVLLREFARWEEQPSIGQDLSAFMHRVYSEDIAPCLTFPNADVSRIKTQWKKREDFLFIAFFTHS